jgi:hypothetical protein
VGAALPADWRRPVNADRKSNPAREARATAAILAAKALSICLEQRGADDKTGTTTVIALTDAQFVMAREHERYNAAIP